MEKFSLVDWGSAPAIGAGNIGNKGILWICPVIVKFFLG